MKTQTCDKLDCAKLALNNNNNNNNVLVNQSTANSTQYSNFMQSCFSESRGGSVGIATRTRPYFPVVETLRYSRYPNLFFGPEIKPEVFTVGKGGLTLWIKMPDR